MGDGADNVSPHGQICCHNLEIISFQDRGQRYFFIAFYAQHWPFTIKKYLVLNVNCICHYRPMSLNCRPVLRPVTVDDFTTRQVPSSVMTQTWMVQPTSYLSCVTQPAETLVGHSIIKHHDCWETDLRPNSLWTFQLSEPVCSFYF